MNKILGRRLEAMHDGIEEIIAWLDLEKPIDHADPLPRGMEGVAIKNSLSVHRPDDMMHTCF